MSASILSNQELSSVDEMESSNITDYNSTNKELKRNRRKQSTNKDEWKLVNNRRKVEKRYLCLIDKLDPSVFNRIATDHGYSDWISIGIRRAENQLQPLYFVIAEGKHAWNHRLYNLRTEIKSRLHIPCLTNKIDLHKMLRTRAPNVIAETFVYPHDRITRDLFHQSVWVWRPEGGYAGQGVYFIDSYDNYQALIRNYNSYHLFQRSERRRSREWNLPPDKEKLSLALPLGRRNIMAPAIDNMSLKQQSKVTNLNTSNREIELTNNKLVSASNSEANVPSQEHSIPSHELSLRSYNSNKSRPYLYRFGNSKTIAPKRAVISRYIEPLLINGYKFHLRLFFLLICRPSGISTYLYKSGLIASALKPFRMSHFDDNDIHDTRLCHRDLRFPRDFPTEYENIDANKIFDGATDILTTVSREIDGWVTLYPECNNAFEIFGCDLMVDKTGKVYLIEINFKPDFSRQTNRETKWLSNLIFEGMFEAALDPIFQHNSDRDELLNLDYVNLLYKTPTSRNGPMTPPGA